MDSVLPHRRPRHHGLDGAVLAWVDDTACMCANAKDRDMLQGELPACLDRHTWSCLRDKDLKFDKQSQFVLDECDKCLDILDGKTCDKSSSRRPKKRQVMTFSATMTSETRGLCKKFISDPHEIRVDEESKLTLLCLHQCYSKLTEREKNRKLNDLMDGLEINQVVVFVKSVQRAIALDKLQDTVLYVSISCVRIRVWTRV